MLLVDDDPGAIRVLQRILSAYQRLRFATNGADALRLARETPPDLILLDAEMPEMDGFAVCAALKADPALADIPVIFVTSHLDISFETRALELGAMDFIAKPLSAPRVQLRVRNQLLIKQQTDLLRRQVTTDALTGIDNRRAFDLALPLEWRRAVRGGTCLSLMMIDVDHFKDFNDRYGHPAGDRCLRQVATALQAAVGRPGDMVARYGGEEFAVLLPETAPDAASELAEGIRQAVIDQAIPHDGSPISSVVTVSIGIASAGPVREASGENTPAELLARADTALYDAKQAGRNCARSAPPLCARSAAQ
ncbi:MAG: diguanylate cyclase [Rhodocyclaceae bacterium]|nr:diguanylate cyclase [Rhodocyclaceae bacterium]